MVNQKKFLLDFLKIYILSCLSLDELLDELLLVRDGSKVSELDALSANFFINLIF